MREYIVPVANTDKTNEGMYIGFIRTRHELIRCKDCKYWENYSSSTVNPNVHRCKYWHIGTEWGDYCKRAERKE